MSTNYAKRLEEKYLDKCLRQRNTQTKNGKHGNIYSTLNSVISCHVILLEIFQKEKAKLSKKIKQLDAAINSQKKILQKLNKKLPIYY